MSWPPLGWADLIGPAFGEGQAIRVLPALALLILATLPIRALPARAQEAPSSPTPSSVKIPARVVDVARDLEHPWGLAFLPDGRMLVIWRQEPKVGGANHWGSRLVFRPDGTLFVTLGDRFAYRDRVQDLSVTLGKIIRINPDGSIPQGPDGLIYLLTDHPRGRILRLEPTAN